VPAFCLEFDRADDEIGKGFKRGILLSLGSFGITEERRWGRLRASSSAARTALSHRASKSSSLIGGSSIDGVIGSVCYWIVPKRTPALSFLKRQLVRGVGLAVARMMTVLV